MAQGTGKRLSTEEQQTAVDLYLQKTRLVHIAKKLGVSYVAVRETLKRKGVYEAPDLSFCHRSYEVDDSAFDTVTPASAYWAGMMMSDGYILDNKKNSNLRIGICLHEKDETHLKLFLTFLRSTHPVHKKQMKDHPQKASFCAVSINSTRLGQALARYGVVPRKSKTACASAVVEHDRDFWRGVVDGDGAVQLDKHGMPTFSLVGSHSLMHQFFNFLSSRITYTPVLEYGKRCRSVATVKACGEGAKQICSLLYKDASVCLERKYQTYLQMMNTKNYRVFSAEARANMSKAALKTWERRKSASLGP